LARELAVATSENAHLTFLNSYSRRLFAAATSIEDHRAEMQQLEVPRKTVRFGRTLGQGNYGVVRLATLQRKEPDLPASLVEVAVKSRLMRETDATIDKALFIEGLVLHAVHHPNILTLLGVCTDTLPFLLITELMVNGDLKSYLRACRPAEEINQKAKLTLLDIIVMMEAVCTGLKHLEAVEVIHRDVAARNVLVGEKPTDVKLGDLGAARSVFRLADREYSATTEHMPARWMAPESLKAAKFTNKTDVWAFGVLCWEITSLGQTPYGVMGIKDMMDSLEHGDRLVEAPFTPPGLHKVLLLCWSLDPKRRPSFAGLVHNLGAIRGAIAVSLEARITLDATGALVSVDTGAVIEEVQVAQASNLLKDVAQTTPQAVGSADDGHVVATGEYVKFNDVAAASASTGRVLSDDQRNGYDRDPSLVTDDTKDDGVHSRPSRSNEAGGPYVEDGHPGVKTGVKEPAFDGGEAGAVGEYVEDNYPGADGYLGDCIEEEFLVEGAATPSLVGTAVAHNSAIVPAASSITRNR
jgi:hypothetical protein